MKIECEIQGKKYITIDIVGIIGMPSYKEKILRDIIKKYDMVYQSIKEVSPPKKNFWGDVNIKGFAVTVYLVPEENFIQASKELCKFAENYGK